ncbi:hypothetical protein [Micromonospora musae]|nr:hypothetical protein [Micromonospora musae]
MIHPDVPSFAGLPVPPGTARRVEATEPTSYDGGQCRDHSAGV